MNWVQEISILVLVKQALAEVDKNGLYPYSLPSVGASSEQLVEVASLLGFQLDSKYSDFLMSADGWNGFFQTVDLFGSKDLCGGEKMQLAFNLLGELSDALFEQAGVSRVDVLPIAAAMADKDIFLLAKPDSSVPGVVLWFAGEEIDRFDNFDEFFLAMVDYNREEFYHISK
ncbi:MAG: SMI1/KNR4 family protein [Pseudomonas sp.]|uniref:SMI1/KNR4 family protein n=1 Tax=Pseudomonas sp. TaxID=306 RepID=UPI0033913425